MLETKPLHPLFAAEATGVDLSGPLDATAMAGIVRALDRHAVLVFPGQGLTDAAQVAFSERLGPVATTRAQDRPGAKLRLHPKVSDIS
ncbi:MAG: TauD/TfdA family dioxygenase, partial [Alphaproteobacteria bacterium]